MHADVLVEAVGRLSRAATGDFDLDTMLRELCAAAAAAFEVDGVGVMSTDRVDSGAGPRVRYLDARGGPQMVQVEQLQDVLRQGPCQDALSSGQPVAVADLSADPRWPQYGPAVRALDVRAVIAVPLVSRGRSWGTLDLYRAAPAEWTAAERAAAGLLADVAVSYLVMAADRDTARAAQQQLQVLAMTDGLTGLPNRGLLLDRMTHALAVGRRTGQVNAAVFIDLDRFKAVNDSAGHAAGDAVLVEVARRLTAVLRDGDTVARLGGDEFVLFCENLAGSSEQELRASVDRITDRLQEVLAPPIRVAGVDQVVSASMGAALTTVSLTAAPASATAEDLLAIADTALYEAKAQGRDRVVVSGPLPAVGGRDVWQLDWDLLDALDRGQLAVYYQPIVDAGPAVGSVGVTSRPVRAVEALLRWNHPVHGLLPAEAFVSLAADNGTLPRIGHWVLDRACAQVRSWQRQLGDRAPEVVFCNLARSELTDPALPGAVEAALSRHQLSAGHLGLEIDEGAFADRPLRALLRPYQLSGHPVAVDDFGTSTLSRLVHLGVDYAKIDRAFTAGVPDDPRAPALIDAVVTVAHTLGLRVIAEGVETQAQADHLTAAGCDLLQGFHLGPPMPADDLTTLLTTA